jgi:hypothetical protein
MAASAARADESSSCLKMKGTISCLKMKGTMNETSGGSHSI